MADYRVQCWTPRHKMYAGIGVVWTLLYPIGIPVCIIYALYSTKVPWLATWKRNCAWMRALVHRAMVMGQKAPGHFDPETLTTESISLEHLRMLHRLFVSPERVQTVAQLKQEQLNAVLTQRLAALEGSQRTHLHAPTRTLAVLEAISVQPTNGGHFGANGGTNGAANGGAHGSAHGAANGGAHGGTNGSENGGRASVNSASDSLAVPHSVTVRQMLHDAAMAGEEEDAPLSPRAAGLTSPTSRRASVRLHRSGSDGALSPHAGGAATPAAISRRNSLQNLAVLRRSTEHLVRPQHPFVALMYDVWHAVRNATHSRVKSLRRTMSTMMYSNERDQLLSALLDWAKHDKQNQVSEPRNNLMRWRTQHEWNALRAGGVHLGVHDTTERAAFAKFSFVFADYSVHAWYWCVWLRVYGSAGLCHCCAQPVSKHVAAAASREVVDLMQKLFLTSVIAFIAPRSAVQVRLPNAAANSLLADARGFGR